MISKARWLSLISILLFQLALQLLDSLDCNTPANLKQFFVEFRPLSIAVVIAKGCENHFLSLIKTVILISGKDQADYNKKSKKNTAHT